MLQNIKQNLWILRQVLGLIPIQIITNIKTFEATTSFFGPAATYRGKTTPLSQAMESSNVRSGGSSYCERFQYSLSSKSLPKFSTNNTETLRGETNFRPGDTKFINKGGNHPGTTFEGGLLQPNLSSPEEGRRHARSYRLKLSEQLCGKPTLSNGKSDLSEDLAQAGGLHGKTGS